MHVYVTSVNRLSVSCDNLTDFITWAEKLSGIMIVNQVRKGQKDIFKIECFDKSFDL